MVKKLFSDNVPAPEDELIDAGCGEGAFIEGILQYCQAEKLEPPVIRGIELDGGRAAKARDRFDDERKVSIETRDYLVEDIGPVDYVIGNPPYVSLGDLPRMERDTFRDRFETAKGRFDLYMLFFEQTLRNLQEGGRACLVTPEKFAYVNSAETLRKKLGRNTVRQIRHLDEDVFSEVAYPTVTVFERRRSEEETNVILRSGEQRKVTLPSDGRTWSPFLRGFDATLSESFTLNDLCVRISCGVATGADSIFVQSEETLPEPLERFAHPTISGKQLGLPDRGELETSDVILVPYEDGALLSEGELGSLKTFLKVGSRREKLEERSCVKSRGKEWYAFHDNLPMGEMKRKKILCKDIAPEPEFWLDEEGDIVPRHSVYYIVPKEEVDVRALLSYLNSERATRWLKAHCQRAANGFYRLQSSVLKELPVPYEVGSPVPRQERLIAEA